MFDVAISAYEKQMNLMKEDIKLNSDTAVVDLITMIT